MAKHRTLYMSNGSEFEEVHVVTDYSLIIDPPDNFPPTAHNHDASNITSGVFPQSKVAFLEESLNIGLDTPIVSLNGHTLREVFETSLFDNYQLVVNGDFSDGTTGWSNTTLASVVNGELVFNNTTGSYNALYQEITVNVNDKIYYYVNVISSVEGFRINYGEDQYSPTYTMKSTGTQSGIFTANQGTTVRIMLGSNGGTSSTYDNSFIFNISTLIANKQYSPLYQTTFDLMTDEQIKLQMDEFVAKPYLFIDYTGFGIDTLTKEQKDYYYSLYQRLKNDYSRPASDVSAWAKAENKPEYNFSEIKTKPTNLSGYGITDAALATHSHNGIYYTETEVDTLLSGKSDSGHGHSNYLTSIPTASGSVLGGIKVGSRLTISSGTLSANLQSDNNFTTTLKNKLDGIATGATNVVESTVSGWGFTKNTGTVSGTGSQGSLAFWTDTNSLDSLGPGTYPSLTELSYVKGVTSPIQAQLAGKSASGHTHGSFNRTSSVLSGATVFSNVVVSNGIVTNIATRNLTAANIGAVSTTGNAYNSTRWGNKQLRVGDYSSGLSGYITLGY